MSNVGRTHRQIVGTGATARGHDEELDGASSSREASASPLPPQLRDLSSRARGVAAQSPSQVLGLPPRKRSRFIPERFRHSDPTETMAAGLIGLVAAVCASIEFTRDPEAVSLQEASQNQILRTVYLTITALGLSVAVAARIVHNAALKDRFYVLENGADSHRVSAMIVRLAEAVPAERQEAVLRHLAQNWDSLAPDFFAVCDSWPRAARRGAMILAKNDSLNEVLGLDSQPLSSDDRIGALEVLDILSGSHLYGGSSDLEVLNEGQFKAAAQAINLPDLNGAQLFWLRHTDRFRNMPQLPEDAGPEIILAALPMHSVGIRDEKIYERDLPAADARRKRDSIGATFPTS